MAKAVFTKADRKSVWIDQIKTARYMADKAAENVEDGGTCNFDKALVKKEKWFTYAEMIEMFNECGLPAEKASGFDKGYVAIPHFVGQADRNLAWARAFAGSLEEQGFTTSMYYQID